MISAVIPVYNERESLVPLHAEIVETAKQAGLDLEVVFVDDGSSDGSWEVIAELARTHPDVRGEVRLYGELHRFIPVLAAARGFRVGEIEINHRPRKFGHSKYGAWRFIKGFLDLLTVKFLTGFGRRPQHLLGSFGLLCFLLGVLGLAYLGVTWIMRFWVVYQSVFPPLHERPMLIYALGALLLGAQLMTIGFLAELVI